MITRKELEFVNIWANRVPYPGIEYCEDVADKLKAGLKLYQDEYANKKYNISFSNNEEVQFEILDKNIAHMLGIDHKNLSGDFFKRFRRDILDFNPEDRISSYELLNLLVENMDKVLEYDKENSARALNYYKIGIKCDIFSSLANLSEFRYGCINFDKDEYLKNSDKKFTSKSTKFLYTPSNEIVSPYYMMGLRSDEINNYTEYDEDEVVVNDKNTNYIVETLIAPEDIRSFFNNQEVAIPTQILTDDNGILTKTEATTAEKIRLLKEYQSIINQYGLGSRVNIYGDYLSLLMSQDRQKVKTL